MNNNTFINLILEKGEAAKQKARQAFIGLSIDQINWKPSPESWSMAQCLEHLIKSDAAYFATLQQISAGTFKMNGWEKYSPFTRMFGALMKKYLQEEVVRKLKAPGKISPAKSEISANIVEAYCNNLDSFLHLISNCRHVNLEKMIITSPLSSFVTYSLKDAFTFLAQHEHRHINQAIRVKSNPGFPLN